MCALLDIRNTMLERKVVLPFRWLRKHFRDIRDMRQKCKVCGETPPIDYIVSDKSWSDVVPSRWNGRVVCLSCFDRFASSEGIVTVKVFLVNGP